MAKLPARKHVQFRVEPGLCRRVRLLQRRRFPRQSKTAVLNTALEKGLQVIEQDTPANPAKPAIQ
jgi:hypothetical protein